MCDCTTAAHEQQKQQSALRKGQGMVRAHKRGAGIAAGRHHSVCSWQQSHTCVFRGSVPDRAVQGLVFSDATQAQRGVLRMPVAFIFPL